MLSKARLTFFFFYLMRKTLSWNEWIRDLTNDRYPPRSRLPMCLFIHAEVSWRNSFAVSWYWIRDRSLFIYFYHYFSLLNSSLCLPLVLPKWVVVLSESPQHRCPLSLPGSRAQIWVKANFFSSSSLCSRPFLTCLHIHPAALCRPLPCRTLRMSIASLTEHFSSSFLSLLIFSPQEFGVVVIWRLCLGCWSGLKESRLSDVFLLFQYKWNRLKHFAYSPTMLHQAVQDSIPSYDIVHSATFGNEIISAILHQVALWHRPTAQFLLVILTLTIATVLPKLQHRVQYLHP